MVAEKRIDGRLVEVRLVDRRPVGGVQIDQVVLVGQQHPRGDGRYAGAVAVDERIADAHFGVGAVRIDAGSAVVHHGRAVDQHGQLAPSRCGDNTGAGVVGGRAVVDRGMDRRRGVVGYTDPSAALRYPHIPQRNLDEPGAAHSYVNAVAGAVHDVDVDGVQRRSGAWLKV